MITISSLATFLSINADDIKEITPIKCNGNDIIFITLKRKETTCPCCSSRKVELKEYKKRKIKHALFLGNATTFVLKYRRFKCLECGKTFSESNNFAPKKSRVSYETIRVVLKQCKNYASTWRQIGEIAHISDTAVVNIFDRYVNPARGTLPRILCMDECYNKHQFSKPYSCILFDFLKPEIIDIFEDRSKLNLARYFGKMSEAERSNVEYAIIDMWEPYLDIALRYFPNVTVAVDSFHVIKNIGAALDKVRRRVMRRYKSKDIEYKLLKKFNFTLFKEYRMWDEKFKVKILGNKWYNCHQIREMILKIDPELRQAYDYYSLYKLKNKMTSYEKAGEMLDYFINDESILNVNEFVSVVSMLQTWKTWIINSFIYVDGRRLSNGPIEGFNSNFKKVMHVANGLFTFMRLRNRLMYCYNKLECFTPVKIKIAKPGRKKRGQYKKPAKS